MPPTPALIRPGSIHVPSFLEALGVRNISDNGTEISFSCPFPGHTHGDHRPSARMNSRTTAWYCHGCKRHGNAVTFTAGLQDVTNHVAYNWIVSAYGEGLKDVSAEDFVDELDVLFGPELEEQEEQVIPAPVSEATFLPLEKWPVGAAYYMHMARGFGRETILNYGLMYDPKWHRVVTSIRDEGGRLVGWKGRALPGERQGPKYFVYPPEYSAAKYVYLLDSFRAHDDTIIVCEGEWNALMMRQHGWGNAVGLPGSHLSHRQAGLIVNAARNAVLIFDSDEAGFRGATEAADLLEPYMNVKVVPDHRTDPAGLQAPEIQQMIEQAKTRIEWELR